MFVDKRKEGYIPQEGYISWEGYKCNSKIEF